MSRPTVDFSPADALAPDSALLSPMELAVLGVPVRFETNSRYVLDCIDESFGEWRNVTPDSRAVDSLRVRLIAYAGREGGDERRDAHVPVRHTCPDSTRLIAHSPGSIGISDPARREAVAHVSTELAADRAHFRSAMIEALTLALVTQFDRHPLHAAAVARGRSAVLLAGPSGTGKSTLAWMAHQAGLEVLGDDHIWIQLEPAPRIWAWPGRVRLLPESMERAPALVTGDAGVVEERDGKRKLVLSLGGAPGPTRRDIADVVMCALERGEGPAVLERASAAELAGVLQREVAPGFDRFPERHARVVRVLAQRGGWRLRLSPDPLEALPLLRRMLDES
ncbi:MAG: hypothetical protein ACJ8AD_20725 [Gemmatimonadaceae bacterium]